MQGQRIVENVVQGDSPAPLQSVPVSGGSGLIGLSHLFFLTRCESGGQGVEQSH
jgi:hypothetical protein|tara:strand:- start:879 stop:1040 length:162 start_codon:yes stop_codon:yes gene_type:complete